VDPVFLPDAEKLETLSTRAHLKKGSPTILPRLRRRGGEYLMSIFAPYYAKKSPQRLYTIRTMCKNCRTTLYVDGLRDYRCPSCGEDL